MKDDHMTTPPIDIEQLAKEWLALSTWTTSGGVGDMPPIPLVSSLPGPDGVGEHFAREILALVSRVRSLEAVGQAVHPLDLTAIAARASQAENVDPDPAYHVPGRTVLALVAGFRALARFRALEAVEQAVPMEIAVRRLFADMDSRFRGNPPSTDSALQKAETLICLITKIPPAKMAAGLLTRADMTAMTVAGAALSRLDVACVEMDRPRP